MTSSTTRVKAFRVRNPWYRPLEYAKRRCEDKKHREYCRYGGRGIKCTLTKDEAFRLFLRDQGYFLHKPSLDRINPDGDYCFTNCRFIEWHENISNHRPPQKAYKLPTGPQEWSE